MDIEELKGKTIADIRPIFCSDGCYMVEVIFTDATVLKIEREHSMEHFLEWRIEVQ